jgi:hypothetical protein
MLPLERRRDARDDVLREMKNYLPSWHHSADTATNARRSKGDFASSVLSCRQRSTGLRQFS